mgnify:FL=1
MIQTKERYQSIAIYRYLYIDILLLYFCCFVEDDNLELKESKAGLIHA